MALVVKDRVRQTTTTAGTGTVTLSGSVTGFQTFSVIGDGNTTYYAIVDAVTGDWEVGIGTYTASGTTLSRDSVLESSNSNNLVPFAAGTKDVFVTYPADRSVTSDYLNTFTVPQVVSVNSSSDAVRITQTGAGNALVVEDSANPDATPFVITNSGATVVGNTSSLGSGLLQTVGGVTRYSFSADASASAFSQYKSRNATIGSQTVVQSGDELGNFYFFGSDGANYLFGARIAALVDGTPGTNDMPGRLVFYTTADGASSSTERMRIDSAGQVGIGATPAAGQSFRNGKNITGATTGFGILQNQTVASDVTSAASINHTNITTQAAAFTLSELYHFSANQAGLGAGSAITSQYGFIANSSLTGATNNYGFFSNIASGTGRWNFYANGTAANYFAGKLSVGSTSSLTTSTGLVPKIQVAFAPNAEAGLYLQGAGNIASGSQIVFSKTRGASAGDYSTAVQSGDGLGFIPFEGSDGVSALRRGASISVIADGLFSATSSPAYIAFSTTASGSTSPTERMRISNAGVISLGAAPGSESLRVTPVASAVNYWNFQGSTTGNSIAAAAAGSDTNIALSFFSKAAAGHLFYTNASALQFYVAPTINAVNYLQVSGRATGAGPSVQAQGSDTNITLEYYSKGTGGHAFYSSAGAQFFVAHTASAVNYGQVTGAVTGSGPIFSAQGSDTNINLRLAPKGTGQVQELVGSTYYALASQYDVGTASNQIPLNQYLGTMAFQDSTAVSVGTAYLGISSGNRQVEVSGTTTAGNYTLLSRDVTNNMQLIGSIGGNLGLYSTSGGNIRFYTTTGLSEQQFQIERTASAVNYVQVTGAATGGAPTMSVQGSDTNIDLSLTPKGTGRVRFGTHTATADTAISGYIEIKDSAGNTRKLAVIT